MPQPTETALMEQIERLVVPPGQLALWGLGQAGFILKGGPTIVCGTARPFPWEEYQS